MPHGRLLLAIAAVVLPWSSAQQADSGPYSRIFGPNGGFVKRWEAEPHEFNRSVPACMDGGVIGEDCVDWIQHPSELPPECATVLEITPECASQLYERLDLLNLLLEQGVPKDDIKKGVILAGMAMGARSIVGDLVCIARILRHPKTWKFPGAESREHLEDATGQAPPPHSHEETPDDVLYSASIACHPKPEHQTAPVMTGGSAAAAQELADRRATMTLLAVLPIMLLLWSTMLANTPLGLVLQSGAA